MKRHIIGGLIFIVSLLIVSMVALSILTRHNKELVVPDFTGMSLAEAKETAALKTLRIDVIDSVYAKRMSPGAVYSQNPMPGTHVKKNRRILITINAVGAQMVAVPALVGFSLRQAIAELQGRGLSVGKLSYEDDIATNNVLDQTYKGKHIAPGEMIESESEIDLKLGLNPDDCYTFVPNLVGYTLAVAKNTLFDNSLNIGKISYDASVQDYADSLRAQVYRQIPEAIISGKKDSIIAPEPLMMGSTVSLYLTIDQNKLGGSK
ncbi:MAG: PASTA domain-containing protein [Bacteroidales bacterium]|nr:PASTA domain-containing protein [Bacteroidales bacterium]